MILRTREPTEMRLTLEAEGIVVTEGSWETPEAKRVIKNHDPLAEVEPQVFETFGRFVQALVDRGITQVKMDGSVAYEARVDGDKVISEPKVRVFVTAYTHRHGLFKYETVF